MSRTGPVFRSRRGEALVQTGWQALAWRLRPNHFHLVVETPQATLAAELKWLFPRGASTVAVGGSGAAERPKTS